jgi:hypothetical protein
MSFRNWFNAGKQLDLSKHSPAVQALLRKTIVYLRRRAEEDPSTQIRPAMLALAIGENEMLALTALDLLQSAGVTKAHMGLYCASTMQPLGEYEPGGRSPESLPCPACGEPHDLDNGTIQSEIFFSINPEALAELKEAA